MIAKQPDYYQLLPPSFWKEADALVNYINEFPFTRPTACPICGGSSFNVEGKRKTDGVKRYLCHHCRTNFSRLTGTPFTYMKKVSNLGDFVTSYLSGNAATKAGQLTGISGLGALKREKIILTLMQEHYPNLYTWWASHHFYADPQSTKLIKKQQKDFLNWLTKLLNTQQITCPTCKAKRQCYQYNGHPYYHCSPCGTTRSVVFATELKRMSYPHLWLDYAKLLTQGVDSQDIAKKLNIAIRTESTWRKKLKKQIELLGYHELIQWIDWQIKCYRFSVVEKKARSFRQKKHLEYVEKQKNHNKSK